jgi:hypothetical protein
MTKMGLIVNVTQQKSLIYNLHILHKILLYMIMFGLIIFNIHVPTSTIET